MASYPPDLVGILTANWGQLIGIPPPPPLPSDLHLRKLLDTAYAASLTREEGRPTIFRLLCLSSSVPETPNLGDLGHHIFFFDRPRPCTAQEIRRLAPAADPADVYLVCQPVGHDGLELRGLLSIGASWRDLNSGETGIAELPPRELTIAVDGPGSMQVETSGITILSLRAGELVRAGSNVLKGGPIREFFSPAVEAFVSEVVAVAGLDPNQDLSMLATSTEYFRTIVRLLLRCRSRQHGGMVLFVKEDEQAQSCLQIKYAGSVDFWPLLVRHEVQTCKEIEARKLLTVSDPRRADMESWEDLERSLARTDARLSSAIGFLADLTSVDGCVLLTDRFRLCGFGVVIGDTLGVPAEVTEIADDFPAAGQVCQSDRYGTRHRSAFRFCGATEHAVAFVFSQDGGVRAARRVAGQVNVYAEITLTAEAWFLTGEDIARHRLEAHRRD